MTIGIVMNDQGLIVIGCTCCGEPTRYVPGDEEISDLSRSEYLCDECEVGITWAIRTMNTLSELFEALKSGDIPLSDRLPVFADAGWNNPVGVWSWDATHAIVGTCPDDLRIVLRSEFEIASRATGVWGAI